MFSQSAPNLKLNGLPYSTYLDDPSRTSSLAPPPPPVALRRQKWS